MVAQLPIQEIVLETDAPYLAPTPFRGKRNESGYLIHIADKVADIFGLTREQVTDITTKNALQVYKV